MKKKNTTPPSLVCSLEDISGLSVNEAADKFADRYQSRSRAYVEMGKIVWHLENRAKIPRGQSIYGLLQKRGVPESSVNNARLVEKFITAFVVPGLVSETRADEIITFRIVNQCARLTSGKSAVTLAPEDLADLLNTGAKAAIGDELDSLDEHGLSIAGRKEAEEKRKAEEKRIADANAAASQITAPAEEETQETDAVVVDGTKPESTQETATAPAAETPAAPPAITPITGNASSSHHSRPSGVSEVIARIDEIELQSYDLAPEDLLTVREKLVKWVELLDSSLEVQKKSEKAAA